MKREQAEKLLGALIFDDLDEVSKAQLLAYLETDADLRESLADLRMALKVTTDAVEHGPAPVLSDVRLKRLEKLSQSRSHSRMRVFAQCMAVAACIAIVATVFWLPSLSKVRRYAQSDQASSEKEQIEMEALLREYRVESKPAPSPSSSELMAETPAQSPMDYGHMVGKPTSDVYAKGLRLNEPASVGLDTESSGNAWFERLKKTEGNTAIVQNDRTLPEKQAAVTRLLGQSDQPVRFYAKEDVSERFNWQYTQGKRGDTQEKFGEYGFDQPESGGVLNKPSALRPTMTSEIPSIVVSGQATTSSDKTQRGLGYPVEEPAIYGNEMRGRDHAAVGGAYYAGEAVSRRSPVIDNLDLAGGTSLTYDFKDSDHLGLSQNRPEAKMPRLGDQPEVSTLFRSLNDPNHQRLTEEEASEFSLPPASRFKVMPVNPWILTQQDALSTFALDVDTASYALCRQYIQHGFLPPAGAVRMEEFVNAFDYAYPQREAPVFNVMTEGTPAPFAQPGQALTLVKIAVKARTVGRDQRKAAHLVFVVDASASMGQADRLPVIQQGLSQLVKALGPQDRVSLVSCSDQARLLADHVSATDQQAMTQTIQAIQPSGSTNLLAGLQLGYATARRYFQAGQINQVVLCSDGVANVGSTEAKDVLAAVAEDRKQGIMLMCVGVGFGAYNDVLLEALANGGDGRYVFVDSADQVDRMLVQPLAAALQTVAKDARIQVKFNPDVVRRYRLIGYENRDIKDEQFRDDTVDAGEVGSGQCATALYEIELTDQSGDLGTVFVRYQDTDTQQFDEISRVLPKALIRTRTVAESPRFYLAACAARFAEWLRQSEHATTTSLSQIRIIMDEISAALPLDQQVRELADLVRQAEGLPRAP